MRKTILLLVGVGALAGWRSASTPVPIRPKGLAFVVHAASIGADTLVTTVGCFAVAPTTQCGVNASATGGVVLLGTSAGPMPVVAVGATGTIAILCSAPGANVVLSVSLVGLAPGRANSANTATTTLTGSCPLKVAPMPNAPVLTPFVVKSGG